MSTTPPRKGKKRQAPQTPSGKPPAKARPDPASFADTSSRSTPGPSDDTFRPADPFTAGAHTRAPSPTPGPSGSATAPMATDDPESPSSVFPIPTVTTEIDEAEAESSFQELQSWTRYIAQHPGQRTRLLKFTAEVQASLETLLGGEEREAPAMYAAAAATSAHLRKPKKAYCPRTSPGAVQHLCRTY